MIEDRRKIKHGKICFDKLAIGNVFEFDGYFYMKSRDIVDGSSNAINLSLQKEWVFDSKLFHGTLVKAKVVIED